MKAQPTAFRRLAGARVRVGHLLGVPVWLHWSIVVAVAGLSVWKLERYGAWPYAAAYGVSLFSLVLLHEAGHVWAARRLGCSVSAIELWALGGVARIESTGRNRTTALVVAAGPGVNAALVPIFSGWAGAFGDASEKTRSDWSSI